MEKEDRVSRGTQRSRVQPPAPGFNWLGFVLAILLGASASLLISLEDGLVNALEIVRALSSATVAAIAFTSEPHPRK
jgi:ABC-type transport system involved in cytochrome c biogenesis permease component